MAGKRPIDLPRRMIWNDSGKEMDEVSAVARCLCCRQRDAAGSAGA